MPSNSRPKWCCWGDLSIPPRACPHAIFKGCCGFRFEFEKNISRCACSPAERNQSAFASHGESRLSFKAQAPRSALCLLEEKKNRDCRATNWLNQTFSSFCLQAQVKFWCVYGFTQRRAVFACFWVRQGFISFCFSYLCMGSAYYIAISVKSMHVCTQEVVHSVALLIRPKVLDTVISDIQASAHINSHAFIFVLICSESTDLCIYFYFRFIILLFLTIKSSHYDLNANINVDCQGPDLFWKGDTNLLGMKEAKFL